ncbi:FAD-binding oxidoreductase [Thiohalorhabdus methylotrophus]|uniref:FAD-binding oxidoreductase n=1 Tax=Thiohalorhabdus methylotrophus TaxID=3242694 RepID=A0ABV4TSI8_9GAMM
MTQIAEILMTEFVTHDVKRFIVSRPEGLQYEPGQGVALSVNEPGWEEEERPFTPTSLRDDRVLEFTIKRYPGHQGVTEKLHSLQPGAQLLISEAFGTLTYQGGGWFIAGGAGITPMMAMLRTLAAEGRLNGHGLIFANKTPADIICEREFQHYLGDNCIYICDRAAGTDYAEGHITKDFLTNHIEHFDQHFYTCGPPKFDKAVNAALEELGASPETLVFER